MSQSVRSTCAFARAEDVNDFMKRIDFLAHYEETSGKSVINRRESRSSFLTLQKQNKVSENDNKIIAGAPGMQTLERMDSGISACSSLGSGKTVYNLRSRTLQEVSESEGDLVIHKRGSDQKIDQKTEVINEVINEENSIKQKDISSRSVPTPSRPLQSFKWIKVNADSVRSESYFICVIIL